MPAVQRSIRCISASVLLVIAGCSSSPGAPPPTPSEATLSATSVAASTTPTAAPTPSPRPTLTLTTEVATTAPKGAISIDMTPDALTPRFKPDVIAAKSGTVSFFLTGLPISGGFGPHHDMLIGPEIGAPIAVSAQVQPDTSAIFTVQGLAPGTYRFWCDTNTGHGPHHTLGMVGTLTVD